MDVFRCARGRIDHSEQGNIVVRKNRQARVGECVLHFGSLIKRETAKHAIAHSARAQRLFKGARLRVRAIEHRNVNGRIFAMKDADGVGNVLGFRFRVAPSKNAKLAPEERVALRFFRDAGGCWRRPSGGVENFLRGAIFSSRRTTRAPG